MEVTVQDILKARDDRVLKQNELLKKYGVPVICFTMNIAGPKKISPVIEKGFSLGLKQIFAQLEGEGLKILHFNEERIFTGCTAYFAVDCDAVYLKKLTVEIEDKSNIGRLFDIDVIDKNGKKIEREIVGLCRRKCLLCDNDAVICAKTRAHPIDELKQKTNEYILYALKKEETEKIACFAVKSLLFEVLSSPKPGLVDRFGCGSHSDMDIFTFASSVSALYPYFLSCAECGADTKDMPPEETFKALRLKGKIAEKKMFDATGGINTHKGAIFSIGLLCAASGRNIFKSNDPFLLLDECKKMVNGICDELSAGFQTEGKKCFNEYGIKGIRGEAASGFPTVKNYGYPALIKGIKDRLSLNDAGLFALLHIILNSEDTNMIKRSNPDTVKALKNQVEAVLNKSPYPSTQDFLQLDKLFTEKNVSPGGSADLLSMCYYLYFYSD